MSFQSPLLGVLQDWINSQAPPEGADIYEYRFCVSGVVYNDELDGDPFRSELGALLMEEPLVLWKVGYSYDEYPQEIATWIKVRSIELKTKGISFSQIPHKETATDFAAILTLHFRRLVTVAGAISVTLPEYCAKAPLCSPKPQPFLLKSREARMWPRFPIAVVTGPSGRTYEDPNAKEVPISPSRLKSFLLAIASHEHGAKIISAVRLYHRAMENLFSHTDVSYLLLVCAADALASIERNPMSEDEILATSAATEVTKVAKGFDLNNAQIKDLALAAIPDPKRSLSRTFREFLLKWGAGHARLSPVFNATTLDLLEVGDESAAIELAYKARSGYVHHASAFSEISVTGTTLGVSPDVFFDILIGEKSAPSILWLERIVAHAISTYITTPKMGTSPV